jgi:hypothetical protein
VGTLALHLAVGLLLGLALRLAWRHVPLAALLAALPDLDHFAPLTPRVTFHNVLFALALPAALCVAVWSWPVPRSPRMARALAWLRARQGLLAAAPALVGSHLVLDLLPFEVSGNRVALLWPFDGTPWVLAREAGVAVDPTSTSTMVLAVLLLLALVVGALALRALTSRPPAPAPADRRAAGAIAVSLALVMLFPALLAAGLGLPAQAHPEARLALDAAPGGGGAWNVHVQHLGGEVVPAGRVAVEEWRAGARVASVRNPDPLLVGSAWNTALPATDDAVEFRLAAARDGFVYQALALAPQLSA